MDNKQLEELLGELLQATAKDFLARVVSGEATAADHKNIIQLLRDNDITVGDPNSDPAMQGLADNLPFPARQGAAH